MCISPKEYRRPNISSVCIFKHRALLLLSFVPLCFLWASVRQAYYHNAIYAWIKEAGWYSNCVGTLASWWKFPRSWPVLDALMKSYVYKLETWVVNKLFVNKVFFKQKLWALEHFQNKIGCNWDCSTRYRCMCVIVSGNREQHRFDSDPIHALFCQHELKLSTIT